MESRGIELLSPSAPTGRSKIVSFWARTVGIPLILILQLAFLGILAFRVKLELDLHTLSASTGEKEAVLTESAEFENIFRKTQLKLETIEAAKQELCYSCTLQKLDVLKPPPVTITNLSLENEKLTITAETPQGTSFGTFAANIIEEDWIREAAVTSGSLNREGNFVFTMELAVEKEKVR